MLKIAHRGASAYAPENTITAFRTAVEMGADGVELDIQRAGSGELVVIHDDTVDRTTDGKGRVAAITLKQLRRLNIKGGERIPTLADVLDAVGPDIHYFIELKAADALQPAVDLIQRYREKGWKHLMLVSFHHEALGLARTLATGASFEQLLPGSVASAKAIGAAAILPGYEKLRQPQVEEAHRLGLKVFSWTANEPAAIGQLKAMGVDGIISDYPDRLL